MRAVVGSESVVVLQVEVAKFIGAAIQTASGIRGTVKKSVQAVAQDATPGCYRATFEDKLVQSDIVIMKAWVAVQVPKFFNPVTNLLARGSTIARGQKQRAVHKRTKADTETHSDSAGEEHFGGLEEGTSEVVYASASHFMGAKPNSKFCLGPCGLGYYTDWGANAGYGDLEKEASKKQVMYYADQPGGSSGWVGARTVAQIRRGKGVGAPRDKDSLYQQVERVERIFPALKVPKTLQSALPFATKPKLEAPSKRTTLEQRRAVPMEKDEKKVPPSPDKHYESVTASLPDCYHTFLIPPVRCSAVLCLLHYALQNLCYARGGLHIF